MSYTLEISELSKCYDAFQGGHVNKGSVENDLCIPCLTKVVLTQPASDKSVGSGTSAVMTSWIYGSPVSEIKSIWVYASGTSHIGYRI